MNPLEDGATHAGLIALALAVVKVLEVAIGALAKKMSPSKDEKVTVVQFDPEVSRMIKATHDRVHTMHEVTNVKDHDGIPLVYSSRTVGEHVTATAAAVKDNSVKLDRLEDKVDENNDKLNDVLQAVKK